MKIYEIKQKPYQIDGTGETLTALAHDLRTPMCCVSGAAQTALLASRQGKMVDDHLLQILAAVDAMDRMLEGMCEAQPTQQRTTGQIKNTLEAVMRPRAEDKKQKLSIDFGGIKSQALPKDGAALERVLMNLLSNALKYTPEGGTICVTACMEGTNTAFYISDNGMGMKHAFLKKMYLPFARAQESAHLPGKGVGLSIVRRLVRRMDGTISVRSSWGKGTVFVVRIPVPKTSLN